MREALVAALGRVRAHLDRKPGARPAQETPRAHEPAPETLDHLVHTFGLTPFERDVVLLCAGVELDASFAAACAAAHPDGRGPTFSLALAALPHAHWSALLPDAPLRRWGLVQLTPGDSLTRAPLRIDERVLHHLVGLRHLDERLAPFLSPLEPVADPTPTQRAVAERAAATWTRAESGPLPVIQLAGADPSAARAVAALASASLGLDPWLLPAALVPATPPEAETFLRAWEREAVLAGRALVVDGEESGAHDHGRADALLHLLERGRAPVFLVRRDRLRLPRRPLVLLETPDAPPAEQLLLWRAALGGDDPVLESLVAQFNLGAPAIRAARADAAGRVAAGTSGSSALWEACRAQARPRLEGLAERIPTRVGWDGLVLPRPHLETLRAVAAQVRHRRRVHEEWGFGPDRAARGLGISALFAGESGTGKTLAAEVLAHELGLDLWRVDLSQIVSKYIGETEKNLRRVFDAAEDGAGILLFDEADALFGKRSEVKDSHDRYANIEVSYLLQRMESYRGLSILTTNLKDAIDTAFLRRLRFVVHFPFPDAASRAEIWRRAFPPETPTRGLDPAKLARLNVAGGNIRTIALNAAFLAADAGDPVGMRHVLAAARAEYAKLERILPDSETEGWV